MNVLHFVVFVSGLIQVICAPDNSGEEGFGYEEGDPLGPDHWPEKYKTCAGKYQSPIDIEEEFVTRVSLAPLKISNFNTPPKTFTIINNGHTVMVTVNFTEPITLSGGPLQRPKYKFAQFHFHWGPNDLGGSEDMINNHSYPMELHMVFYNADFDTANLAQDKPDGLVVMAYFFEVSPADNPAYKPIVNTLSNIKKAHSSFTTNDTFILSSLLPENNDNYFTYIGSLTTPPCTEGVRWIDFKHPIKLSHAQLEPFRSIRSSVGILTHNFRPVQPLSNRPVWYNSGPSFTPESETDTHQGNYSAIHQISLILLACSVLIVPIFRF